MSTTQTRYDLQAVQPTPEAGAVWKLRSSGSLVLIHSVTTPKPYGVCARRFVHYRYRNAPASHTHHQGDFVAAFVPASPLEALTYYAVD